MPHEDGPQCNGAEAPISDQRPEATDRSILASRSGPESGLESAGRLLHGPSTRTDSPLRRLSGVYFHIWDQSCIPAADTKFRSTTPNPIARDQQ